MNRILYIISIFSATLNVFSQDKDVKKAESFYESHRYEDAFKKYIVLIDNGLSITEYSDVYRKAINCGLKLRKYDKVDDIYFLLSESDQFIFDDAYFYIKFLIFRNDVKKAALIYGHKVVIDSEDKRNEELDLYFTTSFWKGLMKDSLKYIIKPASFNSNVGDFSPTFHPKGIAFTSARDDEGYTNSFGKEGTSYLSQFIFDSLSGKVSQIKAVKGKKHDGVACYDSIDKVWYYSKNILSGKKKKISSIGIFTYNEIQKKEVAFNYNEENCFVAHPCLSEDRSLLWFSSNRKGGLGGVDIWYSVLSDQGWGEPINAGNLINSPGDEMFPYERNKKLYFSSNGHPGFGGLDIYTAVLNNKVALSVSNIGYPMNSFGDDFSLIMDTSSTTGYFSSNRTDFTDRIYSFQSNRSIIPLQATLQSISTGEVIHSASIVVTNSNGVILDTIYADENGFQFNGKPNDNYSFQLKSEDYEDKTEHFNTVDKKSVEKVNVIYKMTPSFISVNLEVTDNATGEAISEAEVEFKNIVSGDVLNAKSDQKGNVPFKLKRGKEFQVMTLKEGYNPAIISINTLKDSVSFNSKIKLMKSSEEISIMISDILYESGSVSISENGKKELDTVALFLKENESVMIIISSHTDSRGSHNANMQLSVSRSNSCIQHLISRGLSRKRFIVKNFGELQLLNHCKDGVDCSVDLHSVNRRTEFILLLPGL